jgi:indole-3-glycerol phosphate synthase
MSDILNNILAVKKDEIAAAKKYQSLISLRDEVESDKEARAQLRGFESALRSKIAAGNPAVIAEVKKPRPPKASSGQILIRQTSRKATSSTVRPVYRY